MHNDEHAPNKAQYISPPGMPTANNLDKVRDILFGENIRDNDKKMGQIEEKLRKEAFELRMELKDRMDSLEQFIKKELDEISQKIRVERDEREFSFKSVADEIKDSTDHFEKKVRQLEEDTSKSLRETREVVLEQNKNLSENIRSRYEELQNRFQHEINNLNFEKTDRSALASLLVETAMRLNEEFKVSNANYFLNEQN